MKPMFLVLVGVALLVAACGGAAPPVETGDGSMSVDDAGSGDLAGSGACGGARVLIAFYSDAACSDGSKVGQRSYDTSLSCFSWTSSRSAAGVNSATRFQCYRDRLCYTQHPGSLTCGDGGHGRTDKQARLGECIKEPDGLLYSKLISGTEPCPAAPAGFECPLSPSQMGTDGIAACTSAP